MTRRLLIGAAMLSVSFLGGGSANAECIDPNVCYSDVVLVEECVPQPEGPCKTVVVAAPLCFGGMTWTGGLCWL